MRIKTNKINGGGYERKTPHPVKQLKTISELFALHKEVEAYLPDQPIYETIRHKLPEMGNVFAGSTD